MVLIMLFHFRVRGRFLLSYPPISDFEFEEEDLPLALYEFVKVVGIVML